MHRRLSFALVLLPLAACQPALVPLSAARGPVPMVAPESVPTAPAPAPMRPAAPREAPSAPATPVVLTASKAWPELEYLRSRQLMVPVKGATILDITDSFDDARDGGERVHRAVDIRAPRGTLIIAPDDGRVLALKSNRLGGITVYMTDPEQKLVYYFAHLDRYADGLAEGQVLRKGSVLGYVGTTGNAPKDVPHLHFQVMRMADTKRYWDGPVLDPRPYFVWDGGMDDALMKQGTR